MNLRRYHNVIIGTAVLLLLLSISLQWILAKYYVSMDFRDDIFAKMGIAEFVMRIGCGAISIFGLLLLFFEKADRRKYVCLVLILCMLLFLPTVHNSSKSEILWGASFENTAQEDSLIINSESGRRVEAVNLSEENPEMNLDYVFVKIQSHENRFGSRVFIDSWGSVAREES